MPVDVANLSVVHYPAPVLRTKAKPVAAVTDEVRAVIDRMYALMDEEEGIGLAAPQVGLSWRLFVVDVPELLDPKEGEDRRSPDDDPPTASRGRMAFINPVLSKPEGELVSFKEGCLSLPEIRGGVLRPEIITVTALDAEGKSFTLRSGGLLARCIQHEYDHLEGMLIIDRMAQLDRMKNRQAIRDLERSA